MREISNARWAKNVQSIWFFWKIQFSDNKISAPITIEADIWKNFISD